MSTPLKSFLQVLTADADSPVSEDTFHYYIIHMMLISCRVISGVTLYITVYATSSSTHECLSTGYQG